jgi:hypothetical protein
VKSRKKQYRFNPSQMMVFIARISSQQLGADATEKNPFCKTANKTWYESVACQLLSFELDGKGEKVYASTQAALSAPETIQKAMQDRVHLFAGTNLGKTWVKWMKTEGYVSEQQNQVIKKLKDYYIPDGKKSTEAPWLEL